MRELISGLHEVLHGFAAEFGLHNPHKSLPQTPKGQADAPDETLPEIINGFAAEVGLTDNPDTPTPSQAASVPFESKIAATWEALHLAAAELGCANPPDALEPPANNGTDTITLEDLIGVFRIQTEQADWVAGCYSLDEEEIKDWEAVLDALHKASPEAAFKEIRSLLEDTRTIDELRQEASAYIRDHFASVRLLMIAEGIDRHKNNPDLTAGRKQGLCDCAVFLENVVDAPFKTGETAKLKQGIDRELRALCKQNPSLGAATPAPV